MKNSLFIFLFFIQGCRQLPFYILSKENPKINKTRKANCFLPFSGWTMQCIKLANAFNINKKRIILMKYLKKYRHPILIYCTQT